mmetsp:Transcript_37406/g.110458  ORF Transcript_37406/g.110458 Transcript_37406/m.110458 type:complete len:89 (+) Transcript_37406:1160-1426(+)
MCTQRHAVQRVGGIFAAAPNAPTLNATCAPCVYIQRHGTKPNTQGTVQLARLQGYTPKRNTVVKYFVGKPGITITFMRWDKAVTWYKK